MKNFEHTEKCLKIVQQIPINSGRLVTWESDQIHVESESEARTKEGKVAETNFSLKPGRPFYPAGGVLG